MQPHLQLLAALALAFVPAPPPKSAEADLKAMQGGWDCVFNINMGQERNLTMYPLPAEITNDRMGFGSVDDTWTLTLNAGKSPRHMTFNRVKPLGGTDTLIGIYKLDGDTLTIAFRESSEEKDRPTNFDPKEAKVRVMSFKRKKP